MHKILLVEDDEIIRQQVKQLLEQWGYEVVAVEDFMDVLGIFVESDPHLILMDIGLPLYNGYHWCQEIRKVSKVPIMFLSSRDQAMDIVMAINMGGDDFVTKPFDQNGPPCQGPRALAPLLRILGQIKSAGAPGSYPQSQVHGLGV